MHRAVLASLYHPRRRLELKNDDLVLHGGTALHVVYGSPRYSEDLDFMCKESLDTVRKLLERSAGEVETFLAMHQTTADLDLSIRVQHKQKSSMLISWFLAESPIRHGLVRVKAECYSPVQMHQYRVATIFIDSGPLGAIAVSAGSLDAIMGDKIVALACRPYLKYRDLFDLYWLAYSKGIVPRIEYVEASAKVYGYSLDEIHAKLVDFIAKEIDERDVKQGVIKWLPESARAAFEQDQAVAALIETAKSLAQRIVDEISSCKEPKAT